MTTAARLVHMYASNVMEHGPSEGCSVCDSAKRMGNSTVYINKASCRSRFEEIFRVAGIVRLKKADERMSEAVYRASEGVEAAHAEAGQIWNMHCLVQTPLQTHPRRHRPLQQRHRPPRHRDLRDVRSRQVRQPLHRREATARDAPAKLQTTFRMSHNRV